MAGLGPSEPRLPRAMSGECVSLEHHRKVWSKTAAAANHTLAHQAFCSPASASGHRICTLEPSNSSHSRPQTYFRSSRARRECRSFMDAGSAMGLSWMPAAHWDFDGCRQRTGTRIPPLAGSSQGGSQSRFFLLLIITRVTKVSGQQRIFAQRSPFYSPITHHIGLFKT